MACRNRSGNILVETLLLLVFFGFLFFTYQVKIQKNFQTRHHNRWENV